MADHSGFETQNLTEEMSPEVRDRGISAPKNGHESNGKKIR